MGKALRYIILFSILALIAHGGAKLSGFSRGEVAVTALPSTQTVLDYRATLKSVKRTARDVVEIRLLYTRLRKDPTNSVFSGGEMAITPNAGNEVLDGETKALSETTTLEWLTYRVPASARKLSVSRRLISHEGSQFSFPAFAAKDLPVTRRIGTQHVTVRGFQVESSGQTRRLAIKLELSQGFNPYSVRMKDEQGRVIQDPSWGSGVRQGVNEVTLWPRLAPGQRPKKIALELVAAREHSAWVKFANVPITPLHQTRRNQ